MDARTDLLANHLLNDVLETDQAERAARFTGGLPKEGGQLDCIASTSHGNAP